MAHIISKKRIKLDEEIPVYCMEVPSTENFLVMTGDSKELGVFAHNCKSYNLD